MPCYTGCVLCHEVVCVAFFPLLCLVGVVSRTVGFGQSQIERTATPARPGTSFNLQRQLPNMSSVCTWMTRQPGCLTCLSWDGTADHCEVPTVSTIVQDYFQFHFFFFFFLFSPPTQLGGCEEACECLPDCSSAVQHPAPFNCGNQDVFHTRTLQ